MIIKCLIIDDEPLAIKVIEHHLSQITNFELVQTFQNPLEAFELLKTTKIDLIFLDIQMPLLTGIDFVKSLKNPPKIIFITAFRNYAIESYELDVVDYLLKPISFIRFFKAINKFKNLSNLPVVKKLPIEDEIINDHIYVNENKKYIKIKFNNVLYIESIKDYVRIHLANKSVITKDSISKFETRLSLDFLRIHRSYIVNKTKITAFTKMDVEIGDKEIPIGASYKDKVLNILKL
jgi:DNA-binding LytR/AlgR family response regulator